MIYRFNLLMRLLCASFSILLLPDRGRAQEEVLVQWGLSVADVSSTAPGTVGFALQATGEPNATCELTTGQTFDGLAWRPFVEDAGLEWIEVQYAIGVHAFSIEVHQALNPGAITAVSVRDGDGNLHQVWAGEDTTRGCPGVLQIDFPSLGFSTNLVRVELNTALVPGWNQIDAIKLVGFGAEAVDLFFRPVEAEAVESPASFLSFTVVDYDHDGWPDVFGLDISKAADFSVRPPFALLHNEGNGTFSDRSSLLPVRRSNSNAGRIFGDYDNDGDLDLFIAGGSIVQAWAERDILLRNDGGSFAEVTDEAGLTDSLVSSSAIWWDYNLDGRLDLYVGHGDVQGLNEAQNSLLRNNGDGTFTETTAEAGLDVDFHPLDVPFKEGSIGGMVAADFNGDGWPDLYVSVLLGSNRLFLNDGQGGFKDATTGDLGAAGANITASVGDIDNDGDLDIFQGAAFPGPQGQFRSFMLLNLGEGQFLDVTDGSGLAAAGPLNAVYSRLADIDNDGDLDLLTGVSFVLFLNDGDGFFEDRTFRGGLPGTYAMGDSDGDGFLDVWFDNGLYLNRGNDNHFLRVELVGTTSNRDGIGARLTAVTGEVRQTREHSSGNGYLQDEMVVHFGLGSSLQVDELEIRWPSGQRDLLVGIPADQTIRVIEGRGDYYAAEKTVWEVEPPASVTYGETVDLVAVVRPALFEPTAEITRVTADLSRLGGPDQLPLEDLGNGTYRLAASFVVGGDSDLRDLSVFIEQETSLGTYWINLSRNISVAGDPGTAVVEERLSAIPQSFTLHQNYPNPFNAGTVIRFALPEDGRVDLAIYNLVGQRVATLVDGRRQAGSYAINWDGRDDSGGELASGAYLYRLRTEDQVATRKLLLLK